MPFLNGMNVESILGEAEVWSLQARVTVRKGHNFWSYRWISMKLLQEFSNAIFFGDDLESPLCEATVWSR
jgi:hypothetical protein